MKNTMFKKICEKYNIGFFTSVFNLDDLPLLRKINKKIIKIPSHEIYNIQIDF